MDLCGKFVVQLGRSQLACVWCEDKASRARIRRVVRACRIVRIAACRPGDGVRAPNVCAFQVYKGLLYYLVWVFESLQVQYTAKIQAVCAAAAFVAGNCCLCCVHLLLVFVA
jgi:hypothetical protein